MSHNGSSASQAELDVMRHSAAHVLAKAVQRLYPGSKLGIGPVIDNGFFYDIDIPSKLSEDDLPRIEETMREIVASGEDFSREEWSKQQALEHYSSDEDNPYKREIVEGLGDDETISFYKTGSDWLDLCRGPHVANSKEIGAFKLTSISGAYWRGDEKRPQLQRIYGTAWPTQDELDAYLHRLEEAERRDHRRLGRQLDLFSFPEELGAGLAVWHPRGGIFRKQLEDYVRNLHLERGYDIVATPHLARSVLWETSGHLEKYRETMYPPMEDESGDYYVKPMNCPFHVLIYKSQTRSYRDLPMRLSELGTVYRHERAGVLHGLLRIRGFTQDDSHVICREDQLIEEILRVFDLTLEIHRTFGFTDPVIALSTKPGVAIGNEEMWGKATEALRMALDRSGMPYQVAEGEGAFYGPKVDFHFHDAIGRLWQLTTVQCDFALPERFDMEYMAEDNERHRPVMIHRAILGSVERFSGVLVEHYAGAFPLWLAPEQIRIVPIADRHAEFARGLAQRLREQGLRAQVDESRETMQKKIRAAQLMKIPYTIVLGDREIESGNVAVRDREGNDVKGVPLDAFILAVVREALDRAVSGTDLEELKVSAQPTPTV
jgi:threonyl-tRNA synthetase